MQEPYYFRPSNYEYKLQSHPSYGFCVGVCEKSQIISVFGRDFVELIWFDSEGKLKNVEKVEVSELLKTEGQFNFEISTKELNEKINQKYQVRDETISIKRFWLENSEIGIEDFTETLKEFIFTPDNFDEEESQQYSEILEEWKIENQYVFWCGQDYYINEKGFVETS